MSWQLRLRGAAVALACFSIGLSGQTGMPEPSLTVFDQTVTNLIAEYGIPGASLTITQNGKLVYARGFGYADAQNQIPMQPGSRFRVASLTKAITAVSVMHLVEQGLLTLEQPAFALVPDLQPPAGAAVDPRLATITIRNLLNHTGGWDDTANGSNFDPMFNSPTICKALGVPAPASTENIIRYMRGRPLQFDPGTQYVYSNFGYAVLGRIIERVTGQSYEQYVRQNVLGPMGISAMRIGQTLPQGQLPGEVVYKSGGTDASVFADVPGPVPWPYGSWYIEAMDSHGGWVASTIDYAKFLNAIDGHRGTAFLSPASIAQMTAKPTTVASYANAASWYGFGIQVNTAGNWNHTGSLDGTATVQLKYANGLVCVLFMNYRPVGTTDQGQLLSDAESGLAGAIKTVTAWPATDQFVNYQDTPPQTTLTQPALITREGVENAATFSRGVVSGSWISLFGVNLSASTRQWNAADIVNGDLPTALDNVSVKINGQPAFVEFISPTVVNVQAPAGLPAGWVTAEVINGGVSTGAVLTNSVLNAPGAFAYSGAGTLFAVATNLDGVLVGDPSITPGAAWAVPGSVIVIYGSGLDPSAAGLAAPAATNITSEVKVVIGGQTATLSFAGLIAPGLFQINATVPRISGGDQPMIITIGGSSSPATMIAVQP
jgi:uncharacterized protein (TIGR03437 family)